MKALALCLLLVGCAAVKPAEQHLDVKFRFVCTPDGSLLVGAFINDETDPYAAVVGRCIGELKIIGASDRQTPTRMKVS